MLEFDEVPPVDALVPDFVEDARLYRRLEEGDVDEVAAAFFDRLRMLNTFVVLPLVLFLMKQPPDVLSEERRDRCFSLLESYLMRRMLCGNGPGYNRFFVETVLKDIEAKPELADEVILEALRKGEGEATLWPSDEHLDLAMLKSRAYGNGAIARSRLLAVLWEIERTILRSGKSEHTERRRSSQIEHIMPQKWRLHWAVAAEYEIPGARARGTRARKAVHRLGNLTLVTEKLDPSLSNAAWTKKRERSTRTASSDEQQVGEREPGDLG